MAGTANQTPEESARDRIDKMLRKAGWAIQDKTRIDLGAGSGQAVREYVTDVGEADYVLFVDRRPVGVIEAKREQEAHRMTVHEAQTEGYARAKLKWVKDSQPLRFLYESTGVITRFTDHRDPRPRAREVFSFHQPETLREWVKEERSLRGRLELLPKLNPNERPPGELGLRVCQETAITRLDDSFRKDLPRALVQMATGAGKTYTAITAMYRLLKHADAKRILFLVDTKNLGEQAEQEMMGFVPSDDNRKFTELYTVQRLTSSHVPTDSHVCISTIQRLYAILRDQPLDAAAEEINPAELTQPRKPMPVVYNSKLSPEFFDFIFIDECHRSIYNVWQQVLDYFDAYLVGLTATPDARTFGFFKRNVVSDYSHEKAVADGVNVGNEVYIIATEVTSRGATLQAEQLVERRERLTRRKRWELQDEDEAYASTQLDRSVVNPDQIRTVIRTFRDRLPDIFPGRRRTDGGFEVPKTLIFAKTDSHADDIITTVREEFGEGNAFCKKVTYRATEDPKSVLAQFRNDYYPRIAVTVDMIATGTDVRPLECLLFMRDVKSRNYFEQMKGRGTRTLGLDDLRKVTPSAATGKTHYVIVDAIGVTKSLKTASQPLITKPSVALRDLAMGVMMGARDEDSVASLAGRLARLNQQIDDADRARITEVSGGVPLSQIVGDLLAAIDPDRVEERAGVLAGTGHLLDPGDDCRRRAQDELVSDAAKVFTGELVDLLDSIRREKDQTVDHDNLDSVLSAGWGRSAEANARTLVDDFESYLREHRDTIEALSIFFDQPHRRRDVTYAMIRAVLERLRADRPALAPLRVWQAHGQLDEYRGGQPLNELAALVALIRRVCGIDETLTAFDDTVRRNFQNWILKRHSGSGEKFNDEQMVWLRMIRDHVTNSFHMDRDDLELAPFDQQGGLGRMHQLFGAGMDELIENLNEILAA